jgi:hypothetical protein
MVPLTWRSHGHATVEDGLRAVEGRLVDQWLEIAALNCRGKCRPGSGRG